MSAPATSSALSLLPSPSIQMARGLASAGSYLLDELGSMTAFDLFKVQLESGSTEAAIDAMKRLGVVCQAIGPAETTTHVVPYLTRLVLQQQPPPGAPPAGADGAAPPPTTTSPTSGTQNVLLSDELLLLLGQQIIDVNAVVADQQDLFLPLLERLAAVEETVVRDQAVTALASLCDQKSASLLAAGGNPNNDVISSWLALVKRLSSADWFTAKVSSCGIVAPIFALVNATSPGSSVPPPPVEGDELMATASSSPTAATDGTTTTTSPPNATPQQLQCYELLLGIYKELCRDETPMVRRAAAKHFGQVLKQAGWYHNEIGATFLGPVLCRDEQDSVRLLAVASLKDAGLVFGKTNPQWTIKHWLPIIKDGSTDMSWYVLFVTVLNGLLGLTDTAQIRIVPLPFRFDWLYFCLLLLFVLPYRFCCLFSCSLL